MSFGDIILIALAMIFVVPLVQMVVIPFIALTAMGIYKIYECTSDHVKNDKILRDELRQKMHGQDSDYIPRDK